MKEKTGGFQMKTKLLLGVALLSVGLSVAPPTIVEVEAQTTHVSVPALRNSYPYNLSHYLEVNVGSGQTKKGSAILIAPNTLLTAAHVVADDGTGRVTSQTWSGNAVWGDASPYYELSEIKRTNTFNPFIPMPGYGGTWDASRDVALVKITTPSRKTQTANTANARLGIYSNTYDLVGRQFLMVSNSINLYGRWEYEYGTITEVRYDGLLQTNITGVKGQSGSPVVVDGRIIGVVSNIDSNSKIVITPLTMEMKTQLFDKNGIKNIDIY
ncbi:TPA: trypsin-like peptidase domain-containing protein [Streptococcus suis]|nr:trypsin-like peptidase domain-containing protein [Streptococcus suis]HEM3963971.1 trypsin-like peptidase domain-containing protein [Streptococcus suis]HEM3972076.1 trypsin-like peptidase domain-containing protein [Streptococcus suis]HEM3976186.1 trypsin-like peptidase domain-containing protein [Streptococcus suis]HEM3984386.1 trypsin-like peptidase domain-containing protein [Streptococcus suis]